MKPARAEFGRLLRVAVDRQGLTATQVGKAVGVTRQMVSEYMGGRLPAHDIAARLSEALGEPRLYQMALQARIVNCESCGREAVSENQKRRFCSDACSAISRLLRDTPTRAEKRALTELAIVRDSVDEFCRRCEPDGLCRTKACELRPVSPLPLLRQAADPIEPRLTGWTPERRLSLSRRMKKVWAENHDERSAAISAGMRRSRARKAA